MRWSLFFIFILYGSTITSAAHGLYATDNIDVARTFLRTRFQTASQMEKGQQHQPLDSHSAK